MEPSRVIFIYITAGDAGRSDGWWEARERAALAASYHIPCAQAPGLREISYIHGHPITKYVQKNSVSYCMRLPDGLPDGAGSPLHRHQSLMKLRDQKTPMVAVDGSSTYTSWEDFCMTLAEMIKLESEGIAPDNIWIHAPEYDSLLNPNDHADHKATAAAIRIIAKGSISCSWWLCYYIYYCPPNLSPSEIELKRGLFLSYSQEVGTSPNEIEWICWGHQAYCRDTLRNGPDLYEAHDPLKQFDLEQLSDKTPKYQQCGRVLEKAVKQGLCITNQLTQKSVLLNPVAAIFWNLLQVPRSLEELNSILAETYGDAPSNSLPSLLESLLNAKLIQGVRSYHGTLPV